MTSRTERVPHLDDLAGVPVLIPDSARAEQLRARCHAQLARQRRRSARRVEVAGFGKSVLGPAIVWGLCVVYVSALVRTVVSLVLRRT